MAGDSAARTAALQKPRHVQCAVVRDESGGRLPRARAISVPVVVPVEQ